jgi:hypothetical protein
MNDAMRLFSRGGCYHATVLALLLFRGLHADVVQQTISGTAVDPTGPAYSLADLSWAVPIQPFDTTLGTLNGVSFGLGTNLSLNFHYACILCSGLPGPIVGTYDISATLGLTGIGSDTLTTPDMPVMQVDPTGCPEPFCGMTSQHLSLGTGGSSSDVAQFEGNSPVDIQAFADAMFNSSNFVASADAYRGDFADEANWTLTATYDYTPFGVVPEPHLIVFTMIVCTMLIFFHRGRVKLVVLKSNLL